MAWSFDCERIRTAREARDVTQSILAEKAGITVQQLSAWENGVVAPGQDSLMKICNALDVPPKFFYVQRDDDNHHEKEAA